MKVIPLYLPQFHQIPENDEWWGEGFTEWTNVKKAQSLFDGHYQPRVPLNNFYYDLSEVETLRWQCRIAQDHGIYGFCFYHYWFNGKLLLEKPMEMLLSHPDIDIKYCISWANHNWENTWSATAGNETTLIWHDFDDEADWVNHFNYLLKFFKDPRYIIEENRPLLIIYIPNIIKKLNKMLKVWNNLAISSGFDGLKFAFQSPMSQQASGWDRSMFDYGIEFNPGFVNRRPIKYLPSWIMNYTGRIKRRLGINRRLISEKLLKTFDYDETWKKILDSKPSAKNALPSAFVGWDNTPRKGDRGSVCIGVNPEKFRLYFTRLLYKTKYEYQQDKIFLFAWNEWAEGGYLEPDSKYGFQYLEAIRDALADFEEKK